MSSVTAPKSLSTSAGLTLDVAKLLRDYGEQLLQRLRHQKLTTIDEVQAAVVVLAQQYAAELERSDERGLRASANDFNRWIGELFELVAVGCSHAELIKQFLDDLAALIDQGKSDALFSLVIEQVTDGRNPIGYRLGARCGKVHNDHWRNFEHDIERLATSRFLDDLFTQDSAVPLQLAAWISGYDNLLDSFARAVMGLSHRSDVVNQYWLTAVSLIATADDGPRRIVFVGYRNIGTALVPNLGKGAGLETRVLDVLRTAYRQIARQAVTMHEDLAKQREDIVKTLYPSIYAHDFMTPIGNIYSHALIAHRECRSTAALVLRNASADDMLPTVESTLRALNAVNREVTDLLVHLKAYAILEAKQEGHWSFDDGLNSAVTLTQARLMVQQVTLTVSETTGMSMKTAMSVDLGMFIVVVFNLVHNAVNMMELNATSPMARQRQKRCIQIAVSSNRSSIEIIVANTDTVVLVEHRERIFKKGFSTRGTSGGGGRGLFLCKHICAYLGGTIVLLTDKEREHLGLAADLRVAFKVKLPTALSR